MFRKKYKVVYNTGCSTLFTISEEAVKLGKELAPNDPNWQELTPDGIIELYDIPRHDKVLVQVVEILGTRAWNDDCEPEIKVISQPFYKIVKGVWKAEDVIEPGDDGWISAKG